MGKGQRKFCIQFCSRLSVRCELTLKNPLDDRWRGCRLCHLFVCWLQTNMRPHSKNRIHLYLKNRGSILETRGNQLPVFALGLRGKRSVDCFSGFFVRRLFFQLHRYLHDLHQKQIHSEICCIDPAAASFSPFTCLSVFVLIVLSLYVYFCLSICLSVYLSGCLKKQRDGIACDSLERKFWLKDVCGDVRRRYYASPLPTTLWLDCMYWVENFWG